MCVRARASVPEEPYLIGPNWDLCAKCLFALMMLRMRGEIINYEMHWYEIRAQTDLKWDGIDKIHRHGIHPERDTAVSECMYRAPS